MTPGNAGAYVRKTVSMAPGDFICGYIGQSCGNATALCFRGCSEATQVRFCIGGQETCACAEGGKGGLTYCSTNSSYYCCYRANGFCVTRTDNELKIFLVTMEKKVCFNNFLRFMVEKVRSALI